MHYNALAAKGIIRSPTFHAAQGIIPSPPRSLKMGPAEKGVTGVHSVGEV